MSDFISRLPDFKTTLKNVVKKYWVPELRDRDDFEVKYESNESIVCPKCEVGQGAALFYRINGQSEWIQASDTEMCEQCKEKQTYSYLVDEDSYRKKLILERLTREYYLIPDNLRGAGFKNYEVLDGVTGKAKEQAIKYTKDFIEGDRYNLLIQGSPGTGKSHLCVAIARTIKAKNPSISVGFLTTGELLRKIKDTYPDSTTRIPSRSEKDIFEDLKKIDCLILDDLGSESTGGNNNWRLSMLFEVVNSRLGKPTIYTSNLTDDLLPTAIGDRVFSRLYDNTKFIDLFTDDYRKRLKRA